MLHRLSFFLAGIAVQGGIGLPNKYGISYRIGELATQEELA
jgi:hypothetical protein